MSEHCTNPEHQNLAQDGFCWDCRREAERAEAVTRFQENREGLIRSLLWDEGRGLLRHELSATPDRIPAQILHAIPEKFRGGNLSCGFGLGGGTGIGKTQAIAALLGQALVGFSERVIIPSIESEYGCRKGFPDVRWSSWPDEVQWLRTNALRGAEDRVETLAKAALIVLDDLGRERIKGDYTQDWGASQLDYIVNSRYRAELPTIWTTNVREGDLVRLYGAAMVRRLIEPNPLAWVDGLKPFNLPKRTA